MDRGFGRTAAAILLFIAGVACLVFLVYSLANDLSNWVLGRCMARLGSIFFGQSGYGSGGFPATPG